MLKAMHGTLKKWLEELEDETEIISSSEINEEAHCNMVAFGVNQGLLQEWGKDSVSEFLNECANLYKRKSNGLGMVFYSWFDEQAGQIRISAVSQTHGKLPFGCKLNQTSLSHLVDGFYADDSGLFTAKALNVWQQSI